MPSWPHWPTHALAVSASAASAILDGGRRWELRRRPLVEVAPLERVALVQCRDSLSLGLVFVGEVTFVENVIVCSRSSTGWRDVDGRLAQILRNRSSLIDLLQLQDAQHIYAWVLSEPRRYPHPYIDKRLFRKRSLAEADVTSTCPKREQPTVLFFPRCATGQHVDILLGGKWEKTIVSSVELKKIGVRKGPLGEIIYAKTSKIRYHQEPAPDASLDAEIIAPALEISMEASALSLWKSCSANGRLPIDLRDLQKNRIAIAVRSVLSHKNPDAPAAISELVDDAAVPMDVVSEDDGDGEQLVARDDGPNGLPAAEDMEESELSS
eukprot:GEMP01064399.1.p1 GENE.GEMP01064399.1~~GEMP01064399.1.p1  ORF type:complete len:324 (+),score=74.25 GEMP01064399.1:40-1011(+)